jgi:hypothetical protein
MRLDGDPAAPLHRRALLCVVLGLAAFALLLVEPFLALALSLPAVTIAVHARREVLASRGALRGHDLAGAGLALGVATLPLAVVALFLDLL